MSPGDYVYADASGAVVIPAQSLERVIEEALKVEEEDAQSLEENAAGHADPTSHDDHRQRAARRH